MKHLLQLRNPCLRSLIVILTLVVCLSLPVIVLKFFLVFADGGEEVKNLVRFASAPSMVYPQVTVCHPFYFNKGRLESKQILKELKVA